MEKIQTNLTKEKIALQLKKLGERGVKIVFKSELRPLFITADSTYTASVLPLEGTKNLQITIWLNDTLENIQRKIDNAQELISDFDKRTNLQIQNEWLANELKK